MSELEIVRGNTTLEAGFGHFGGNVSELRITIDCSSEPAGQSIDLPRLEVLQLRDWLNTWLSETPP